jgi:predicted alpha/beta hydrolase
MKISTIENLIEFPPFTIPAEHFRPDAVRALAVLVPALGTSASYYRPFAERLAASGHEVLLPELPGTGHSRPKPSRKVDFSYQDLVCGYLAEVQQAARRLCPDRPFVLLGHSLGAQAGALAMLGGVASFDALVTLAGGHIHYRNWAGVDRVKIYLGAAAAASLSRLLGHLPGQHVGFGGPQARTLMLEWSRTIRKGHFPRLTEAPSGGQRVPVLCVAFENDFMAPVRSVGALAEMVGGEVRELPVSWAGNPHASWARNPEATVELIDRWLLGRGVVGNER